LVGITDRTVARELAKKFVERGDPTGWFEELYRMAEVQPEILPWVDKKVNPHLVSWAEKKQLSGKGQQALVVGCGYGDDAEWLASRGFEVLAFDISSTAISVARRRFPSSSVIYQVAHVLNLPAEWRGAFDFVFEAYTLQVLRGEWRVRAARNIASAVKNTLLVIARGREDDEEEGTMP
jgi:2-polyprenyl-3-methyl-5-hydroxy-6-metoxy-1,4-benzoquinol methylase